MRTRYQATPRSKAWKPGPGESRLRPRLRAWLEALLLLAIIVAAGVDSVRW